MNNMDSIVNARSVLLMFAELDSKRQRKVYKTALKKSLAILVRETRKNFRRVVKNPNSRNWWNGRTMVSGIKSSVNKEATEGKAHIMGDFRLKFFEKGTKQRYRKNGGATGKITAKGFFKAAREAKESVIIDNMDRIISESIRKINGKYKNR